MAKRNNNQNHSKRVSQNLNALRNVGISAHVDSGKTTLTERMLYYSGRIHRIREVRGGDGGATMDSHPIEERRGITINSAATRIAWRDHDINIIDTPGHVDFTVEVERSLRVLDGAVLVLCASRGVQSQTLTVDRQMQRYQVPRIAFINKMDRVGADFETVMQQMAKRIATNPVAIQMPIGAADTFEGVVDLVAMQTIHFEGLHGTDVVRQTIPELLVEQAFRARTLMVDQLAMADDFLMSMLLDGKIPSENELRLAIRRATLDRKITPVLTGSAYNDKGVQPLLDAIVDFLPSPIERKVMAKKIGDAATDESASAVALTCDETQPTVAMAFKTVVEKFGQLTYLRVYQGTLQKGKSYFNARTGKPVRLGRLVRMHADAREDIELANAGDIVGVVGIDCYSGDTFTQNRNDLAMESFEIAEPVVRLAIAPENRDDADKLALALDRLTREDPTFQVDADSGETLIAGMGQLHLQVYIERIEEEYGCKCIVGSPSVTYQERPSKPVQFAHQFRKQSGGPGQFAKIVGSTDVLDDLADTDFHFEDKVSGGRIERRYIAAFKKGVVDSLEAGPLGGYPVVGLSLTLIDGDQHSNDSSEIAFTNCARQAMKEVILPNTGLELWEPIMKLEIECPVDDQGNVTSQLIRKRGSILGSAVTGDICRIHAEAPLAELFDYSNEIRSITKGNGTFTMEPQGYQPVPVHVQNEILK